MPKNPSKTVIAGPIRPTCMTLALYEAERNKRPMTFAYPYIGGYLPIKPYWHRQP